MIWLVATLLLAAGGAFALWPLARHWQAPREERAHAGRPSELDELELEVAAGRLSEAEAAARRRELAR
jgi:cytochrome c-type biogenesis protein CcmI